ncbi:MAG: transglycosylase domain-containing protein [Ardenticatenales bacterium]
MGEPVDRLSLGRGITGRTTRRRFAFGPPRALIGAGFALLVGGCAVQPNASLVPIELHRQRLEAIRTHDVPQTIEIVDRYGRPIAESAKNGYRVWLPLSGMPEAVRQAVIATEDRTFYHNGGVDKRAVARAALQNASAGGTVSGASTITMQLVRLVAFEPAERFDRSLERKAREAYLAAELDERYSKDELLEAYLNIAYFGRRAYGIEAAAERFFGRHAIDLDVAQSTFLAGLLQAPTAYDPDTALPAARARQRTVLDALVTVQRLEAAAADAAFAEPLTFVTPPPPPERQVQHFVDYVMSDLPRVLGADRARRGGFRVVTTIDPALTEDVRAIAERQVLALRAPHDLGDAAVVVLDPRTGEIRAMVGGIRYDDPASGQVNMAVEPRQPGSSFKPITYAAALASGWSPASVVWDVPSRFGSGPDAYQPVNYDGVYNGPVRLRRALANSLNASAINLLSEVGVGRVHAMAVALGLPLDPDPWHYGLSLTLGGGEVPLYTLTSALSVFGNDGRHVPATGIRSVEDLASGAVLWSNAAAGDRLLSADTAWLINDMLSDPAARTPAFPRPSPLELPFQAAVKTGTTNDFRDNLTVGWTPYIAVGVWAGNKDGHPMRDVVGITGAAPIWHDVMVRIHDDPRVMAELGGGAPPSDGFVRPDDIVSADVCDLATLRSDGSCTRRPEPFAAGHLAADIGVAFAWIDPATGTCADRSDGGVGGRIGLFLPGAGPIQEAAIAWARTHGTPLAPVGCAAAGRRLAGR